MKKIILFLIQNKRIFIITFELFWIAVFLLDLYSNQTGASIPQFIYINF